MPEDFSFFQIFFEFFIFHFLSFFLMRNSVMTPFSLRDSNQRTACARSVGVSPHVCCQVYKVQVSVCNSVADATGSRVQTTSIHKYPPSVSCHVPRCSIPSQHISPMMRPNELPQNPISINNFLSFSILFYHVLSFFIFYHFLSFFFFCFVGCSKSDFVAPQFRYDFS